MKQYTGVQSLRAVAALMVVIIHCTIMMRERMDTDVFQFSWGAAGVDIFFVISGFIMVITTARSKSGYSAKEFIKRRLLRIVPLYWVVTLFKILLLLIIPTVALNSTLTWWHTIASFLFIPAWNSQHLNYPIVVPGWTLSFEMFFYFWFALALKFKKSPSYWLTPLFAGLSIIWLLGEPFESAISTIFNPRLIEFCLGMWTAKAAMANKLIPARFAHICSLISFIFLCTGDLWWGKVDEAVNFIFYGIPAVILLLSVVSLEQNRSIWHNKFLQKLGDASYAIYLFHPFIIISIAIVAKQLALDNESSFVFVILGSLITSAIAGMLLYRYIEKPMMNHWRKYFTLEKTI